MSDRQTADKQTADKQTTTDTQTTEQKTMSDENETELARWIIAIRGKIPTTGDSNQVLLSDSDRNEFEKVAGKSVTELKLQKLTTTEQFVWASPCIVLPIDDTHGKADPNWKGFSWTGGKLYEYDKNHHFVVDKAIWVVAARKSC